MYYEHLIKKINELGAEVENIKTKIVNDDQARNLWGDVKQSLISAEEGIRAFNDYVYSIQREYDVARESYTTKMSNCGFGVVEDTPKATDLKK